MKAASLTALTLVLYLLLSSLSPMGTATPLLNTEPEPPETALFGNFAESNLEGLVRQADKRSQSSYAASKAVLTETLRLESAALRWNETEQEGVPVSAVDLPNTAAAVVSTPFVETVELSLLSNAAADLAEQAQPVQILPISTPTPEAVVLTKAQSIAPLLTDQQALADQELESFTASVVNGQAEQVAGVYVQDVLALPVIQQPDGSSSFVSDEDNMITQFSAPKSFGTVGLLAHNYLSGKRFFDLAENQDVIIIHGDGHQDVFRINKIQQFQALSPTSVYSNFIDLADPTKTVITAGDVFNRVYTTPDQVVFQTCIEAFGDPSWGRIFITAERIQQ